MADFATECFLTTGSEEERPSTSLFSLAAHGRGTATDCFLTIGSEEERHSTNLFSVGSSFCIYCLAVVLEQNKAEGICLEKLWKRTQ
ncbi:hypothetical protein PoB_002008600 [Plakobranchus ocellatus]|uniref:Uncharacterized protein n=1 Tax=Plakobranchus ocellatus TaxID=259542 RepID=A0AAV3ZG22_9GAST|nr:hypothetical protein PoB_002008600 [Plakobranchus ocellatus]